MKLRNRMYFLADLQMRHAANNLLIEMLLIICAAITMYCVYTYESSIYTEKKTKEVFGGDISGIYCAHIAAGGEVQVNQWDKDNKTMIPGDQEKIYTELRKSDYFDSIGEMGFSNPGHTRKSLRYLECDDEEWLEDIIEFGTKHCDSKYEGENRGVNTISVYLSNVELADIRMADGTKITKEYLEKNYKGYDYVIFPGYGFREFAMNKTIHNTYSDTKLIVAGILDKNQIYPQNTLFNGIATNDNFVDMTYTWLWIEMKNDDTMNKWSGAVSLSCLAFKIKDGYNRDEVFSYVEDVMNRNNMTATFSSLDSALKYMRSDTKKSTDLIRNFSVMLIVTTVLISASIQVVNTYDNMAVYGVYLSCGMSRLDILIINIIENVIRILVASVIGFAAINALMNIEVKTDFQRIMNYDIFYRYSLPIATAIMFVMCVVATVVPFVITYKKMPSTMIGGKE